MFKSLSFIFTWELLPKFKPYVYSFIIFLILLCIKQQLKLMELIEKSKMFPGVFLYHKNGETNNDIQLKIYVIPKIFGNIWKSSMIIMTICCDASHKSL